MGGVTSTPSRPPSLSESNLFESNGVEMSDVKKPADRKSKAGAVKVVTVEGVKVTVVADALDDFELLDDLAAIQDGNGSRLPAVLRRLVGDDYKRVLDELRGENGRVAVARAAQFITELFKVVAPNS